MRICLCTLCENEASFRPIVHSTFLVNTLSCRSWSRFPEKVWNFTVYILYRMVRGSSYGRLAVEKAAEVVV